MRFNETQMLAVCVCVCQASKSVGSASVTVYVAARLYICKSEYVAHTCASPSVSKRSFSTAHRKERGMCHIETIN